MATPLSQAAGAGALGAGSGWLRSGLTVATVRLFAAAREAAGTGSDEVPGATVREVLAAACARYGAQFEAVLATSRVWVNGSPAEPGDALRAADEVAVLPPVSGGCR